MLCILLWSCSRTTQLNTCNQCLFTVLSTFQFTHFFSCLLLLDIELHNPPELIQRDILVHSSETAQWGRCQCAHTGPLLKVVHRHRTGCLGTLQACSMSVLDQRRAIGVAVRRNSCPSFIARKHVWVTCTSNTPAPTLTDPPISGGQCLQLPGPVERPQRRKG